MSFIWETFSVWLLTAGLVTAGLAVVAALIDLLAGRNIREFGLAFSLGCGLVIVFSLFNVFIHSRDGYTAVVPTGLILSAAVVLIMMITGWIGGARKDRHAAGVSV